MIYRHYITSSDWERKRLDLIEDNCYICGYNNFLQEHHLHYHNLGNEKKHRDTETLCKSCHDALKLLPKHDKEALDYYKAGGIRLFIKAKIKKKLIEVNKVFADTDLMLQIVLNEYSDYELKNNLHIIYERIINNWM